MAYTTINKSTAHFNTKLYTGNNSTNVISGVGFQPDWFWIKDRSTTGEDHHLFDVVRGLNKALYSSSTGAETTGFKGGHNNITAVGTDGFTITGSGSNGEGNLTGRNYASWNWKAGGTASANTAGTINSTVSVNTTAGFSIVKFTGTGANATVGHGLGAVPKMIILKKTNGGADWIVYHNSMGNTKALKLNTTAALSTDTGYFNSATPTSTVFSLGNDGFSNGSNATIIAYCFAEKQGYSKFGSYLGNGNADGTFVYTGFKPAFVLIKITSTTNDWEIHDNKRGSSNVINAILQPNLNVAESTSGREIDFLSNGFKLRNGSSQNNNSGSTFIYMAFGQSLVGTNNVPCTAR